MRVGRWHLLNDLNSYFNNKMVWHNSIRVFIIYNKFNKYVYMRFLFVILLLLKMNAALIAQSAVALDLEREVYALNNAFQYDSSQQLIQRFLLRKDVTNEDRYFAHLYLSYTYKRLYDYASNLAYLDKALSYGMLTPHKDEFIVNINCQKALALFDMRAYAKADSLMHTLAKTNYQYLNEEYRAKIIMQEAYLFFLKKNYPAAEKRYELALQKMHLASICDLPMIYAKMIELYAEMNNDAKMQKAYQQSVYFADSCDIFKYTIYTNESMSQAYARKKDYSNAYLYLKQMDQLREEYNDKENLNRIADLDKKYQTALKDTELTHRAKQLYYSIAGLCLLMIVFLGTLGGLFYQKKQRDLIAKQNKLNEHLINILSHDIKEPLLGIKLLLKKMKIQDPFLVQASHSLERQITTVNEVLSNLLYIKNSHTKNQEKVAQVEDIWAVITKAIRDLTTKWDSKNIDIEINIEKNQSITMPISKEKLYIIVYNLLNNAIKYSYDGGIIKIYTQNDKPCIRDFGIGISKEEEAHLLKEVVSSREGTSLERGNGLGLYLIGELIKDTKIKIAFLRPPDVGTIVQIKQN